MKIGQVGEDNLIEEIRNKMGFNLGEGIIGIGDDCAVIPLGNGMLMLLSTDSLVEGCHFIKEKISARDLGYKAVMVNVSDIAAMGGKGLYVLMSVAFPEETEKLWVDEFVEGVKEGCEETGVDLVGGDTTGSKGGIFINLTIVGEVSRKNVKYRSGAKDGNVICVTDVIGDSLAGYEVMIRGDNEPVLKEKHCCPRARFKEGEWLGEQDSVKAMMDISDGLVQDLRRMMRASGCGARVDIEKIPLSKEFREYALRNSWIPEEKGIISGEEYCLLFTVDVDGYEELSKEFEKKFGRPLYNIGVVERAAGVSFFRKCDQVKIESEGYLHFKE